MKKFVCVLSLMVGLCSFANAQTAYEKAKLLDNVSVGVTAGVSTPLDFNSVTPLNTNMGIKLQKDFTPVVGLQAEGLAFVNANHFNDLNTFVKATNVSVSGVINWTNALLGYKGTPRVFEVSSVTGLGWLHMWDTPVNSLSAKTGLDLAFNLGKKKAHSIVITPAVYWNLTDEVQFNKNHAQLAVNASYIYHFKTSNGTHSFKKYDIGAMNDEINSLKAELAKKPTEIVREVVRETVNNSVIDNSYTVTFSKGSYEVSDVTTIANALKQTKGHITIVGGVSPEGSEAFNKQLALNRANAVKEALVKAGVSADRISTTSDYTAQRRATIVVEK